MPRPQLSVVIPAYNEAAAIAEVLEEAREKLDALGMAWEILVVDNASTDRTPDLVATLASDPRIVLLRNASNRGKGHSVRRGMLEARGDLILHCDADCVASFASFPRMLECLPGADVVVGSRLAAGAELGRRQPLRRRIVGRAFVGLCRLVLREPIRDLFCGFKLWRAEAARATYKHSRLDGWVFDAETLAMARVLGFGLRELGIVWTDRAGSRLSMPSVLFPAVRDLLRARAHVRAQAARSLPARPVGSIS
ncbi:MAG: glycosyltransferase [Thermoleophilaceae bacterium]|nr:glycosyltransferase [Thermoleophilaceae bacterium]